MAEPDFATFGVKLDDTLLLRASGALSELYAFGDLELRSAWLYYGSLDSASKAFGVSINTYRKGLKQRRSPLRWKLQRLTEMSDDELDLINDGSQMIVGMCQAAREALFPSNARPTSTRGKYVAKIESWRRTQSEQWVAGYGCKNLPVPLAIELLEAYVKVQQWILEGYHKNIEDWQVKRLVWILFEARLQRPLQNAIGIKDKIKDLASTSKLCAVAIDIIYQYETYRSQRSELHRHIEAQRGIVNSKRDEFLIALEKRDGMFCTACRSVDNLRIDHKNPLSLGGFSTLENLQLLCRFCNGSKGERTMAYLNARKENNPRKLAPK